jgi:hypothetical protein
LSGASQSGGTKNMSFEPTHIVKTTKQKLHVIKFLRDGKVAMCYHELILGDPCFYPANELKEIKNDE